MAKNISVELGKGDDYVEYYLFPNNINGNSSKETLEKLRDEVYERISIYTKDYIWHKDSFELLVKCSEDFSLHFGSLNQDSPDLLPPHLYGITNYGSNIEDEWFIVFLLTSLTAEIDGLCVRVEDADGEFLLIEAANYIPDWATPDTCKNRVYLFNGSVHIIPLHPGKSNDLSLAEGLSYLQSNSVIAKASEGVQKAIQAKIKEYPAKIKQNLHYSNVFLPVAVATLLKAEPKLIAPAIQAFCNKDQIDTKVCRAMRHFPPENCVLARVVFTKCLYAMLAYDKYKPDRCTGWKIPPANNPEYKAHNLGMKLACGFEILVAQAKPTHPKNKVNEISRTDKGWVKFLESLKSKNYFRGLLEGSQQYQHLMQKAEEYYKENHLEELSKNAVGKIILSKLADLDCDMSEVCKKAAEEKLPPSDDDSWLEISPEDLDKMLEEKYGKLPKHVDSYSEPSILSSKISTFLNHISGLEGAEYPSHETKINKNESSCNNSNTSEVKNNSGNEGRISFEPEAFACAVQNILDFVIPEDSWDLESDKSSMDSYDDDLEMDIETLCKQSKKGEKSTGKSETSAETTVKEYMKMMDLELAKTSVGQSFEKMDPVKIQEHGKECTTDKQAEDSFDDVDDFTPVNIDLNALKNILESYQLQDGGPGPASNLLGPMGIHLDVDTESDSR